MRLQEVCVHCLKFRNSCGLKIWGGFLLAVYGVVWYPNKLTLKETAYQSTLAVRSPAAAGKTSKKCVVIFMGRHELDNNNFSAQFPLNAVISHLRKTFQSPLSTVLLIDLLQGCQVLTLFWHVCSPLFIPPCLCASVYVQQCPATWSGTSQIPRSPPKGPLHGQRPPRARSPQSVPGQLRRALRSRWELQNTQFWQHWCLQMFMKLSLFKTLWIRGFVLKVISITKPSL